MKKLAARDWEDILQVSILWQELCHQSRSFLKRPQCAVPVLEGLFPDAFDGVVQDLLFTLCYWHALAKLRMHTDPSSAPETSSLLSGEKARRVMPLRCSANTATETQSVVLHSRTTPSADPEATNRPSGENRAVVAL